MITNYKPKDLQSLSNTHHSLNLDIKILMWAHLNFELQVSLHQLNASVPDAMKDKLQELGYAGKPINCLSQKEREALFQKEAFFSYSQTGKRIVAFALQQNGLNQKQFQKIEESITNAYKEVIKRSGENRLVEKSYRHTLDTLGIFKP